MDKLSQHWKVPQDPFESFRARGYLGRSRPLLIMRKIHHIKELYPFVQHLSRHIYFSATDRDALDHSLIEEVLANDFLEPIGTGRRQSLEEDVPAIDLSF